MPELGDNGSDVTDDDAAVRREKVPGVLPRNLAGAVWGDPVLATALASACASTRL